MQQDPLPVRVVDAAAAVVVVVLEAVVGQFESAEVDDLGRTSGTMGGMPDRSRKRRPTDLNALAASIVADSTDEDNDQVQPDDGKDPAAVALGRKGGLKGGKARAEKLTPEQRSEIARKAARARWSTGG